MIEVTYYNELFADNIPLMQVEVSRPKQVSDKLYKFYMYHPDYKYIRLSMCILRDDTLAFIAGTEVSKACRAIHITGIPDAQSAMMHYEDLHYSTCVYVIIDDCMDIASAEWLELTRKGEQK